MRSPLTKKTRKDASKKHGDKGARKYAPRIPRARWEHHRPTIEWLYERMQLSDVAEHMLKNYQFDAGLNQYEDQLRRWKIKKNMTKEQWEALIKHLWSLPDHGENHEVRFRGKPIERKRINQERSRYKVATPSPGETSTLPEGCTVSPPRDAQSSEKAYSSESDLVLISQHGSPGPFHSPLRYTVSQPRYIFLGDYEPHGWIDALDQSLLAPFSRLTLSTIHVNENRNPLDQSAVRNTPVYSPSDIIDLGYIFRSPFEHSGQLINKSPDYLVSLHFLSSLLNGHSSNRQVKNLQLHQALRTVLRTLPRSAIRRLFQRLSQSHAEILRERTFAAALDAGDTRVVSLMLYLGQDPFEKVRFDLEFQETASFPLERALYHKKYSVFKTIMRHVCDPVFRSVSSSVQDTVLDKLLDHYYLIIQNHSRNRMTVFEWQEYSDLIHTILHEGALPRNECFFVACQDKSLACLLVDLDSGGVNGWIKRGLLSARWPARIKHNSDTKECEVQNAEFILEYILNEQRKHIALDDLEVREELLRALKTAVTKKELGPVRIIVEACSSMHVEIDPNRSEDFLIAFKNTDLKENWETAKFLVRQQYYESTVDQNWIQASQQKRSHETAVEIILSDDDTRLSELFQWYQTDEDLRRYLHTHRHRPDYYWFKSALRLQQFDAANSLFKGITFRYPRMHEDNWALAYILQMGYTAAISAIIYDSEQWALAVSSTLEEPPCYIALENLMYRAQSISPFNLNSSNAEQQIHLRCLCYHAIHTNNGSLMEWLVNNGLDMDEFGVHLHDEIFQVSLARIQKFSAYSGLVPNTGRLGFPIHRFPSIMSVLATQNRVSMIPLVVELGANGTDSMALARAVKSGADIATISTLLQAACMGKRTKPRNYGSAAVRESILRKDYECLQWLSKHVDMNGIELLPDQISDPRFADPLSPLGEAIMAQDYRAIEILLSEGCDPQALVCYDAPLNEQNEGAHLRRLSPMIAAIDLHDLRIVTMLVEKKAPVAPGPTQGILRSPLQRAAEVGCFEIVQYLVSQNVPVDDPPFYSGGTPLQLASMTGHQDIVKFLIENEADPNHPPAEGDGRTAFEAAAEWGRADIMSMLVKGGANLDLRFGDNLESQYQRAMNFAESRGHPAGKRYAQRLYETVAGIPETDKRSPWTSSSDNQSTSASFSEIQDTHLPSEILRQVGESSTDTAFGEDIFPGVLVDHEYFEGHDAYL